MQLLIFDKINKPYRHDFIYSYLPKYIKSLFNSSVDEVRSSIIDKEFNINSKEILNLALSNLKITQSNNVYSIKIDKNKKWNGYNLSSLVNLITYGNRTSKGYDIILRVFNLVANNLDFIYKEYNVEV